MTELIITGAVSLTAICVLGVKCIKQQHQLRDLRVKLTHTTTFADTAANSILMLKTKLEDLQKALVQAQQVKITAAVEQVDKQSDVIQKSSDAKSRVSKRKSNK